MLRFRTKHALYCNFENCYPNSARLRRFGNGPFNFKYRAKSDNGLNSSAIASFILARPAGLEPATCGFEERGTVFVSVVIVAVCDLPSSKNAPFWRLQWRLSV